MNRIKRDIVIVGAPFNKRFALFPLYTEERKRERERERERERGEGGERERISL